MKRRDFIKKSAVAGITGPAVISGLNMNSLFGTSAVSSNKKETFEADTRGFGHVLVEYNEIAPDRVHTIFAAQDAGHADLIASKRLADLLGFGDLKTVSDSKLPCTVIELKDAGWWLLGTEGANFHELFSPNRKALTRLARDSNAASWKAVTVGAYPRWLDCFDNAGPGIWFGGGGASVDITTEFPWMSKHGLTFNFHQPTEGRYVAPGVLDTTLTDWFGAMCARYDIPFRTNLWEQKPKWLWNHKPLPYVRRAPGYLNGSFGYPNRAGESLYGIPYGCEPISASDPYTFDFRQRFATQMNSDPNFLGTKGMSEVAEASVRILSAVAGMPETKAYWHRYLVQELGLDLPKVGLMHHGRRDFYQSWENVEVPIPRDFLNFDEHTVDITGMWEGLADREFKGVGEKWFSPDSMPKEGWVPVHCNDPMILLYLGLDHNQKKHADYWLRRTVTLTSGQLPTLKYLNVERPLHWFVLPSIQRDYNYCDAYLNGRPLRQINTDHFDEITACFEVSDELQAGDNQFVLRMEGRPPTGMIVLGSRPNRPYPYMTSPENRRWYDATNFSAWLRVRGIENGLRAMRAAEPNRPLKLMATVNLLDMTHEICERYGAYEHDTGGAGGYWCPFTGARLARSHGLPWSCEPFGPARDSQELQAQITLYIMYGNDAVDLVFSTTHYKDHPDIAPWFDRNLELLRCVGKMYLPTPKIGVLRSIRAQRLSFEEPLNWDIARGALQGVGRNFAYVEVSDILNGVIDKFPVIMDCGTVILTDEEIEGIRRYVERGGIFVAQHHTGRHSPEKGDTWPLAHSLGLSVNPKWMSEKNFNLWSMAKITFDEQQDLVSSLKGKTIEGSGVSIDWLGKENSGSVAYVRNGPEDKRVHPIATWADDGTMAIVEARLGLGRLILLGTEFYTRMRDEKGSWIGSKSGVELLGDMGTWINDKDRSSLLDEFLSSIGVPRDSWSPLWAEIWRSKNAVYDLYPVARMTRSGGEKLSTEVRLRRQTPVNEMTEVSALGHPKVKVSWKDGKMTLPATEYGLMQSRVFITPRAEISRSGIDWFQAQAKIWRAIPPVQPQDIPALITVPEDVIPAAENWLMTVGEVDDSWMQPEFADTAWKIVKLGSFASLGLPEDGIARFRKTIGIPATWQGRQINLFFSAERSFGIIPQGQLWINGKPANVNQPVSNSFSLNITELAKEGKITLALEVDSTKRDKTKPQPRPAGITGIFCLEAVPPAVATTPLTGPWFAAHDVNVLTPVPVGQKATYTYLETRFTLPGEWPAKRVFIETPGSLSWIILNNQIINAPIKSLDISGLVKRDSENVLRWIPDYPGVPVITVEHSGPVPELNLVWKN